MREPFYTPKRAGFTLVELMISVGIFALVMVLASGAYLMMISFNRQTQATVTGINNLSFALESMTRTIRTGINYDCGVNCASIGSNTFSFTDENGNPASYFLSGTSIQETVNSVTSALTDPSVTILSLKFYAYDTNRGDPKQSRVTMIITGTVSTGPGKPPQSFTVETGATMRGSDI